MGDYRKIHATLQWTALNLLQKEFVEEYHSLCKRLGFKQARSSLVKIHRLRYAELLDETSKLQGLPYINYKERYLKTQEDEWAFFDTVGTTG